MARGRSVNQVRLPLLEKNEFLKDKKRHKDLG
jgi:hypothetical protein